MKLKELLRDWLGVAELEKELAMAKAAAINKERLRKEVSDALLVVLSGKDKYRYFGLVQEDHGSRFEETLRRVTHEQAAKSATRAVNERVGGEAFLDEVVDRLRRKQLDV